METYKEASIGGKGDNTVKTTSVTSNSVLIQTVPYYQHAYIQSLNKHLILFKINYWFHSYTLGKPKTAKFTCFAETVLTSSKHVHVLISKVFILNFHVKKCGLEY